MLTIKNHLMSCRYGPKIKGPPEIPEALLYQKLFSFFIKPLLILLPEVFKDLHAPVP